MHSDVTELAVRAATDEQAREQLIRSQERAILRIASRVTHRFVSKNDDEWSIALYAFSRAVDTYRIEKGPFLRYAETVVRRSLIDELRGSARRAREIAVSPQVFEGETDENDPAGVQYVVVRNSVRAANASLKEEIAAVAEACARFGFGFYELAACSPQQEKTRAACAAAVRFLIGEPGAFGQLVQTRQLPMQALAEATGVSRKLLDRYRRYIIAAAVILSGDYPGLKEYLHDIGEESKA